MKYKELKAGDVRQQGDETIRLGTDWEDSKHNSEDLYHKAGIWLPVRLIGVTLLSTDFHCAAYRRPL